jgi:hypothetical protein
MAPQRRARTRVRGRDRRTGTESGLGRGVPAGGAVRGRVRSAGGLVVGGATRPGSAPFSRPARSAVTLAALTFGLAGVVLGTSLYSSIHKINHSAIAGLGQVQAGYRGGHLYTATANVLARRDASPTCPGPALSAESATG